MTDIYKPPQSNLAPDPTTDKRPHVLWRLFFWINILLLPVLIFVVTVMPGISVLDQIDALIFIYILVGLYSYAYNKQLLPASTWKVSLPLYLLWFLGYEILGPLLFKMTHYGEPAVVDAYITISLGFTLPTAYAFYRLGFNPR